MTGYTKLFGSIVASTIWREPHTVRIVWITMLAMANKHGIVEASLPGLADLARVSIDECKAALVALESPDEHSRTPDNEGRRVRKCDGGWMVLNHAKYRAKMGADEKREYFRLKKQEQRAKSNPCPITSKTVKDSPDKSPLSRHAEAQSETESEEYKKGIGYAVPQCFEKIEGFTIALAGWIESRKKKRNPPTGLAIQLLIDRLSERPRDSVAALHLAIERGWATVKWDWFDRDKSGGDFFQKDQPVKGRV